PRPVAPVSAAEVLGLSPSPPSAPPPPSAKPSADGPPPLVPDPPRAAPPPPPPKPSRPKSAQEQLLEAQLKASER
ncbi:MAG TPA: hypothetical protein PLR99_27960, partial [Polyangiaceae bacterium]|nr:hypothetical protein [Polyangiaceae bacterium]